jgi:hypothetical protein
LKHQPGRRNNAKAGTRPQRRPVTMPAIATIALIAAIVIIGLIVVSVLGFALHFLFSPWLLVAIAILAWVKFRPRRTRQ